MDNYSHNYWTHNLSRDVILYLIKNKKYFTISQLNYLKNTSLTDKDIDDAENKLNIKIHNSELYFSRRRTDNGQKLIVFSENLLGEIVNSIADKLWLSNDLTLNLPKYLSVSRVRNYLERCIEVEIRDTVYLAAYVFWLNSNNKKKEIDNTLIVSSFTWGREIHSYLKYYDINVIVINNIYSEFINILKVIYRYFFVFPNLMRIQSNFKKCLRTLVNIQKHVKELFSINGHSKVDLNLNDKDYKVSVSYRRSILPDERNDLFWFNSSYFNSKDIIITFDSPVYPFDYSELESLESQKFRSIVIDKKGLDLTGLLSVYYSDKISYKFDYNLIIFFFKSMFKSINNSMKVWQVINIIKLTVKVNFLKDYYKKNNVKVDISLDSMMGSAIRTIAINNVGGIRIGLQWSSVELLSSFLSKNDNIYFCWGHIEEFFFKKAKSCYDNLIISGYIYDRYHVSKYQKAQIFKNELKNNGSKFIITIFDSRVDNNYADADEMTSYYNNFLDECILDKTLGIIIKSKMSRLLSELPNVESKLLKAKSTGRCLVLEDENMHNNWQINNIFTFLPALASDLTVSFSISTSGTESAIAGTRSIYYDHLNQPDHPYYNKGGKDSLIFTNLDKLTSSIREYRKGNYPLLGDHSKLIDYIDPFQDGRAGERIGQYTSDILGKLNQGCKKDEAINFANKQYSSKWGEDKVIVSQSKYE